LNLAEESEIVVTGFFGAKDKKKPEHLGTHLSALRESTFLFLSVRKALLGL
jgi:hypothetical protein